MSTAAQLVEAADLVCLRLRAAPEPRAPEPAPKPQPTRRRHQLVYTTEAWAVRIAVDDGRPVEIMVAPLGAEENAASWVPDLVATGPGVSVLPAVVNRVQFGRSVSKRCWNGHDPLVVFGAATIAQRLTGDVRPARGGGLSVGLAGCGAPAGKTGQHRDSWFYARLRVLPSEGEDGGAFVAWQPPARGRKTQAHPPWRPHHRHGRCRRRRPSGPTPPRRLPWPSPFASSGLTCPAPSRQWPRHWP